MDKAIRCVAATIMALFFGCLLCFLAGCSANATTAESKIEVKDVSLKVKDVSPKIEEIGSVSVKQVIVEGDDKRELYFTFDDPDGALAKVAAGASDAIGLLQQTYGLGDFSSTTWRGYYDNYLAVFDEPECPGWYTGESDDFIMLRSFFDIYENAEKNEQIIEQAKAGGIDAVENALPGAYKLETESLVACVQEYAREYYQNHPTDSDLMPDLDNPQCETRNASALEDAKVFNEDYAKTAKYLLVSFPVDNVSIEHVGYYVDDYGTVFATGWVD